MSNNPYVSVDALAAYFGVSVSTVRQWVRNNIVPSSSYIKIGTTYRFHARAVQDALLNHKLREGMTDAERNAIASKIIDDLEMKLDADIPSHISKEKLDSAEAELDAKVRGVPNLKSDPELDDELQGVLDDDLQDL